MVAPTSDDGALLDVGQEGVLLRLVEAVDLVDEEDRAPAARARSASASAITCADLLHARQHGRERHEARAGHAGHERASVVLPVPGGPQRISEWSRPSSSARRSTLPGPMRCSWPTTRPACAGRIRSASGGGRQDAGRRRVEEIHAALYAATPARPRPAEG